MKKITKKIFLAILVFSIMFTTFSFATETSTENQDIIKGVDVSNETQTYTDPETGMNYDIALYNNSNLVDYPDYEETYESGDLYKFDKSAVIDNNINGNVFVIGDTVTISSAKILGNVFVMAKTLNISNSYIYGSVFAIAQDIEFGHGSSADDVYMIAEKINFDEYTAISRSARISANTITLNGSIGYDVYAMADTISLGTELEIDGTLSYTADKEISIPETASIGNVEYTPAKEEKVEAVQSFKGMSILMSAVSFIFKVAVISVFIILFNNKFSKVNKETKTGKNIAKSLGNGALALILVPIIAFVLLFTVIGAGLGVLLFAIYAIVLFLATSVAVVSITEMLFGDKVKSKLGLWGMTLLTALVIWILGEIPVIGWAISFVVFLIGLGFIVRAIFFKANKKDNNSNVIIEEKSTIESEPIKIDDDKKDVITSDDKKDDENK